MNSSIEVGTGSDTKYLLVISNDVPLNMNSLINIPIVTAISAAGRILIFFKTGILPQIKIIDNEMAVIITTPNFISPKEAATSVKILSPEPTETSEPSAFGICFKKIMTPIPANIPSITFVGKKLDIPPAFKNPKAN